MLFIGLVSHWLVGWFRGKGWKNQWGLGKLRVPPYGEWLVWPGLFPGLALNAYWFPIQGRLGGRNWCKKLGPLLNVGNLWETEWQNVGTLLGPKGRKNTGSQAKATFGTSEEGGNC